MLLSPLVLADFYSVLAYGWFATILSQMYLWFNVYHITLSTAVELTCIKDQLASLPFMIGETVSHGGSVPPPKTWIGALVRALPDSLIGNKKIIINKKKPMTCDFGFVVSIFIHCRILLNHTPGLGFCLFVRQHRIYKWQPAIGNNCSCSNMYLGRNMILNYIQLYSILVLDRRKYYCTVYTLYIFTS